MATPVDRRTFVGRSTALGVAFASGALRRAMAASPAAPPPAAGQDSPVGLSTYEIGPQFWVRWNNRVITGYRAHRTQKFPYLFPLTGPASGLSLTAESAVPYPHHRSAWFGCDRVNGGNYWQEDLPRGQIVSAGPRWGVRTPRSAEILDACEWRQPGGPVVMSDRRKLVVQIAAEDRYLIDWDITWEAVQETTILQTNHSLFSVRAAPELTPDGGGSLFNAEGARGEKGTYGIKSAWCAFHGTRPGGAVEGLALFDHPQNPWSPCPWFTRNYGFMSPTALYFDKGPLRLAPGQSLRLRYRLVLFAGSPEPLPNLYRDWVQV